MMRVVIFAVGVAMMWGIGVDVSDKTIGQITFGDIGWNMLALLVGWIVCGSSLSD